MTTWLHRRVERHMELLDPLKLPLRYSEPEFDKLPIDKLKEKSLAYLRDFWENAPKGIAPLFVGTAGTGKTFAAALIAKSIYHRFKLNVGWVNAASAFTGFDRAYYDGADRELDKLKNVPFLVLDDIAQLLPGSRPMTLALEVVAHRFDNLLPTLSTANLSVKGKNAGEIFDTHFGVCMGRRMLEVSEGFRVLTE